MKALLSALCTLAFASGCATASRKTTAAAPPIVQTRPPSCQLPSLETHLTAGWISTATRIQAGDSVIYYRGSAQRASTGDGPWTGTVQGDILFLSPRQAILLPSGELTLQQRSSIKIVGPHRTILARPAETPKWQHLLTI